MHITEYKESIVNYLMDCEGFTYSDAHDAVVDAGPDILVYLTTGESVADAASYLL